MTDYKNFNRALGVTTLAAASLVGASAFATPAPGLEAILDSVDLSTVLGVVSTIGIVVVSIALAFKGIGLAKRLISRA